ncbi:MAG: hypothetical protein ABI867_27690 [Kofleriaceae bacterium]
MVHAIVYSPTEARGKWVEHELARGGTTVQVAKAVHEVVTALVDDSGPRPQILVIDLDALSAGELFHLHQVRELGWCGTMVALGVVPPSLRVSLKINRVIPPPFVEDALADEIIKHRCATEMQTMPLPIF